MFVSPLAVSGAVQKHAVLVQDCQAVLLQAPPILYFCKIFACVLGSYGTS